MKRMLFLLLALSLLAPAATMAQAYGSTNSYTASASDALVILNQLPIYTESGGKLTYKEAMTIGDKVTYFNKIQKFTVDGKEREYAKIKSVSGVEGWARAPYVISKATLAAVRLGGSIIYSEPRDVKMTSKNLTEMVLVAVMADGPATGFAKVVGYDQVADAYWTDPIFVSRDDLTFADTDIKAVIYYQTAKANKAIRANLYKLIEKSCSSSIFFEKIRGELNPTASKSSSPFSGSLVVNDNNVNVRETPDEVNGKIVTQLAKDTVVTALEITNQTYTVGGVTNYWYKIADPAGWVFGSFLSPQP